MSWVQTCAREKAMKDKALDVILGRSGEKESPLASLMPHRVYNLLIVASLYDSFAVIEEGRINEALVSDYLSLNLRFPPRIERVSTAAEALDRLSAVSFDLVISMPHVGNMDVREFGRSVKKIAPNLPVVLLAGNVKEAGHFRSEGALPGIDRIFLWQGDVRLFLAIIKLVEDRFNAWHDARNVGVKSIILVEDSPLFYSPYLAMLYTEVVKQTQALMAEGVNRMQKMLRMRARPRILLATTFEEALELVERYRDHVLGFILDASFPRLGRLDKSAGADLVHIIKLESPDVPILMQTGSSGRIEKIRMMGVRVLDKNSPNLMAEVRSYMQEDLGFGDFVFRDPLTDEVVARAKDMHELSEVLETVPDNCLLYHARRNDFSTWLMARTEFDIAKALRPRKADDFAGPGEIRNLLLKVLKSTREKSKAGVVVEFTKTSLEGGTGFAKIGNGSLGGKGRGLAFINELFNSYNVENHFPGIRISVPPTVVLATDVFDLFMEKSGLMQKALEEDDDEKITEAFLDHPMPKSVVDQLRLFLENARYPIAVRSSSLLEDASYQPFAGIYQTYMIPNNSGDPEVRLDELCSAIKMVYASTFHANAKAYMEATPNRLEEEKMAVIIQRVVGKLREHYFYPNFAGVGRSINYYAVAGCAPEDGIVSVALGLGKTVVEGGRCVRFDPVHPRKPIQSFSTEEYLQNSQSTFLAMDLSKPGPGRNRTNQEILEPVALDLAVAEAHGMLGPIGSVYSPDNDAIYDGISRNGPRLVTMAGVLKGGVFPLGRVIDLLLKAGSTASSCAVEIEFAVNLSESEDEPHQFAFLQIRPMVSGGAIQEIALRHVDAERAVCVSDCALGNGFIEGVSAIVYVRRDTFKRANTPKIAMEVGELNSMMLKTHRPYVLIGPGRWGSADPWLGIPVKWGQISGVKAIVETSMEDIHVEPSQGTHFFQNLTSFGIAYLSPDLNRSNNLVDWEWLDAQEAEKETEHLRLLSFEQPLEITLNGRRTFGIIMKPGRGRSALREK